MPNFQIALSYPAQTMTHLIEVADAEAKGKTARYYRLDTPQLP